MLSLIGLIAMSPVWSVFVAEKPVAVAISVNGDFIAVTTKKEVSFFRRGFHSPISRASYRRGNAEMPLAFSPSGNRVAVLDSGTIKLYDPERGKVETTIEEPGAGEIAGFRRVAFSPDGKTLAAARGYVFAGGTLQLFDVQTGNAGRRLLDNIEWHTRDLGFSPDGKTLDVTCFKMGTLLAKESGENWAFTRFDVAKGIPLVRREVAPLMLRTATVDDDAVLLSEGKRLVGLGRGRIAAFAKVPGWLAIARESGGIEVWAVLP